LLAPETVLDSGTNESYKQALTGIGRWQQRIVGATGFCGANG
jgi:hypothetical protein